MTKVVKMIKEKTIKNKNKTKKTENNSNITWEISLTKKMQTKEEPEEEAIEREDTVGIIEVMLEIAKHTVDTIKCTTTMALQCTEINWINVAQPHVAMVEDTTEEATMISVCKTQVTEKEEPLEDNTTIKAIRDTITTITSIRIMSNLIDIIDTLALNNTCTMEAKAHHQDTENNSNTGTIEINGVEMVHHKMDTMEWEVEEEQWWEKIDHNMRDLVKNHTRESESTMDQEIKNLQRDQDKPWVAIEEEEEEKEAYVVEKEEIEEEEDLIKITKKSNSMIIEAIEADTDLMLQEEDSEEVTEVIEAANTEAAKEEWDLEEITEVLEQEVEVMEDSMMVHNISEEEGVDMKTMEDTVEETDKEVDMKMTLEVIKSTQKINAVGKLT